MYFLYKNEHRIFKSAEITIRRELSRKEKYRGFESIPVRIHVCMELSQGNPVELSLKNFFFPKSRETC
jgi:hypothetical protein